MFSCFPDHLLLHLALINFVMGGFALLHHESLIGLVVYPMIGPNVSSLSGSILIYAKMHMSNLLLIKKGDCRGLTMMTI